MDGCRAKLERANENLKQLDIEAGNRTKNGEYGLTTYCELQTRDVIAAARFPLRTRLVFGAIIGDYIHDLRSALDQMIFGLAAAKKGRNETTAFPICESVTEYANKLPTYLAGVARSALTIIESLQPYHAGDRMADTPLWILNELWNRDKHREISLSVMRVASQQLRLVTDDYIGPVEPGLLDKALNPAGPFEDGAEMVRIPPTADIPPGMNVRYEAIVEIAFAKGWPGEGRSVMEVLPELFLETQRVLNMLAPLLP